jgi:uncharacterized protein YjbJ (UPF0337 family)
MDDKIEDLKGRAKEATGALADDPDLKREGKADQAAAGVKGKADELAAKAHEGLDNVKDKAKDVVDKGRAQVQRDR